PRPARWRSRGADPETSGTPGDWNQTHHRAGVRRAGMRLLVLSPFLPFPPDDGGRIRVYQIATGLAARHEVELLAPAPPGGATEEAARALRARGVDVHV